MQILKTELHGFVDASRHVYAVVICLTTKTGDIIVSVLAAKSAVAPLKSLTIPRFELCGVLLLSRFMAFIRAFSGIFKCEENSWTDITITLAWLTRFSVRNI
jgi:hypothetical protein